MKSNYVGYQDENKNEWTKVLRLLCVKLKNALLYVLVEY